MFWWGILTGLFLIYMIVSILYDHKLYKHVRILQHQLHEWRNYQVTSAHIYPIIQHFCTDPQQFPYIQNSVRPLIKALADSVERKMAGNNSPLVHDDMYLQMPALINQ